MKTDTLPILTEHQEQVIFFSSASAVYSHNPTFDPHLFWANVGGFWVMGDDKDGRGNNRKFALLSKYKSEGWKSGVADLQYQQARGGYHFCVIEMKRSDHANDMDGGLSPEQVAYLESVRKAGGYVIVAYSGDDALEQFATYMDMELAKEKT